MELALFKLFGEEREERSIIVMLLLQSFILGIYYGVFNVAAHAIFLARYDETDMARAYIISGITGIALTYLYSLLRSGRHFSRLSMLNLVLIFLVSLFLWISIRRSTEPWVIFGVFVMLGPLFLMSMTGIRDTSQRLLEGHRGARSNALIDTGLISGCMAGSFFVPLLLSAGTHLHNMLFVSAAGMLVAMLIQYELIRKQKAKLDRLKYSYQKSPVYSLLKDNKYIQSVFLFIVLSVLVAFFVQYSFMAVTRLRYPGENEMATFLGFFEGGMMAFSLLVYTFLFSFILKNHGLKITLALKPVLIALFVLFISVTGLSGGAVQGSQGFFLFFVLLALTRLFSRALNMTIEKPSLKILYHSLTEKARYNIKHAFDGTVNETAVLLSGLLLTGLAALAFIKLVHFSLLLIIISISWTLVALRLYKRYRETIKESLEERRKDVKDESIHAMHKEFSSTSSSGFFIDNNYFEVITSPELHEHIIDNRLILSQVINKAERYPNPNILPLLKNIMPDSKDGNGLPERLSRLIRNIESLLEEQGLDRRKDLVSSIKESPDRKLHLQAIMTQQVPPVVTDLVRLIRDQDIEIKRETIFIAGKFRINELLPEICECLHDPLIAADAYNVLRSFGKEAFEAMAGHFYRSSGSIMVRRLILRLFAETGGSEAIEFLLPRIWSVHRFLKKEAVKGLNKCGYKAQDESREKIFREIKSIIGMLAWNYEIQIILKDNNDDLLDEALEKETDWWTALLFDILALLYDRESLMMIRKSLEEGSVESISLAMETIDIVVDEEIKPPLIALLDVVPLEIKVKSLSVFYPGGKHDYETLVQQLVNKDYNHTGVWTKVCALRSLYNLPRPSETDFLVALLFGVHRILREEALRYLQEQFDDVYHSCSYRLPRIYRDQLDEMLRGHARDLELVHNKLKSLALVFPGIPENTLNKMAEDVSLVNREKTGLPEPGSDFIMWPAITADTIKRDNMIISWHTAGYATEPREIRALEGDHYMLYVSDIKKFVFFEPDKSDDVVKYMDGILLEAEKGESGRERNIVL